MPMTRNALAVLRAIETFEEGHAYPPSYRDLMRMTGLRSSNTVGYHIKNLAHMGLVQREPNLARVVTISEAGRAWLREGVMQPST